jgi:hypothetical protein
MFNVFSSENGLNSTAPNGKIDPHKTVGRMG